MTGFGRAEVKEEGINIDVEIRSLNNRYLDVTIKAPRNIAFREREVKDIVREFITRGSVNICIKITYDSAETIPLKINALAAKAYYKILNELRKRLKLREPVKLEHLLNFSEIFEPVETQERDELEWNLLQKALRQALQNLDIMRKQEGMELSKDLEKRIIWMDELVGEIERLSKERIPEERKILHDKISKLFEDRTVIDQNRLELEIALLADKLDVTEECVRYHSHNKFFLETLTNGASVGRKLNFLVQEMGREANTIASKSNDATISQKVVLLKEEIEKIREQLQNIE